MEEGHYSTHLRRMRAAGTKSLHLDSLVKIAIFIPLAPVIGLILGVCTRTLVSWLFRRTSPKKTGTLFRRLQVLTGSHCSERHGEAKKGEQLRSVLDNGLLRRTLGWSVSVSLEEGLRQTVEYFRNEEGYGR